MRRVSKSINNRVNLRAPTAATDANALISLERTLILGFKPPLWAPAPALCALMYALSMLSVS